MRHWWPLRRLIVSMRLSADQWVPRSKFSLRAPRLSAPDASNRLQAVLVLMADEVDRLAGEAWTY